MCTVVSVSRVATVETVAVKRVTKVMNWQQFVLRIVLGIYLGFSRLNQLRFIAQDPLLTGILKVSGLPPQSTLWRFLHLNVAVQILSVQPSEPLRWLVGPWLPVGNAEVLYTAGAAKPLDYC